MEFELEVRHAPEKVWTALTTPELLAQWLLPAYGVSLEPGAQFLLKTQAFPGWDGTVQCEFIEIEPYRKLSYHWKVPFLETVVTFTLTPTETGTHVRLVQSGFASEQKREFGGARYGWNMMLGKLINVLGGVA